MKSNYSLVNPLTQDDVEKFQYMIPKLDWLTKILSFQVDIIYNCIVTLFSPFTALFSIAAESYLRAEEATNSVESAVLNFPSKVTRGSTELLRKICSGIPGAVHMCMVLTIVMVLAVLLGVGLVQLYVEEPVILRERLFFDYTEVNPKAVFSFAPGRIEHFGKAKKRHVDGIPVGHTFQVSVVLLMPESDYNREAGVFQLTAEILSAEGHVVARTSQPCMLRFKSFPIRLLHTFLMGVPLVLGISEETQKLDVQMLNYEEVLPRTKAVRITISPRAGTSFLPQIYEAKILIKSQLPWRKRLVRDWKWTFCVWTSVYAYMLLVIVLLCCRRPLVFPSGHLRETDSTPEEELKELQAEGREASDIVRRWKERRRKKKAVSPQGDMGETVAAGSSASSMSVTRDDASLVVDDIGDSESACSGCW